MKIKKKKQNAMTSFVIEPKKRKGKKRNAENIFNQIHNMKWAIPTIAADVQNHKFNSTDGAEEEKINEFYEDEFKGCRANMDND